MNEFYPQPLKHPLRLIVFFIPKTLLGPATLYIVLYWWFVPVWMKVDHVLAAPSVWWKTGISFLVFPALFYSRIAAEALSASLPPKWTNFIHRAIAPLSFCLSLFMGIWAIFLFAPLFGFPALQPKVVTLVFCGFVFFAWLQTLKNGLGVFAKVDTSRHWLRDVLELSASELLSRDSRPPILYLRSFEAENTKATTLRRFEYIRKPKAGFYLAARYPKESDMMSFLRKSLAREYKMKLLNSSRSVHDEQAIFTEYFSDIGPYIAISRPGESFRNMDIGSAKLFMSNDDWRSKVKQLIEAAVVIVIEAAESKGLAWEMREVVRCIQPERVLLVLPRNEADYYEFCIFADNIFPHPMPEVLPPSRLIVFNSGWIPVALENYTMILEDALDPFMERLDLNARLNISKSKIKQPLDKT